MINVGRQLLGFDMHIYNQQAVLLDETNTPFMRLYNLVCPTACLCSLPLAFEQAHLQGVVLMPLPQHSECSEKSLFAKDKAQAEASVGKGTKHIPIVKQKRKLSSKLHQSVHSSVQKGQVHAHLIVEFRALICAKIGGTKPADIKHVTFYLYDAESQMQVSEAHTIKVGVSGMTDASKSNEEAAVFVVSQALQHTAYLTRTFMLTLILTLAFTRSHTLSHAHTHSLSRSLTHTRSHSLTHKPTLSHTHSHSHSHSHLLAL